MLNTCVMCGDLTELPEGTHVCHRCEKGRASADIRCPQCGSALELMSSHWYNTCNGHARNTVFHCCACKSDWEEDEEFVAQPMKFTRKFWG